jgi:hypothetical protein
MKTFTVTIPLAGHAVIEIEAENEEEAIEKAFESDIQPDQVSWELLNKFGQGNVCYCPSPWKVTTKININEGEI